MPYITPERRQALAGQTAAGESVRTETAGELNYALTNLCVNHIMEQGLSYAAINEVVGALECAKLELYRRMAVPYENAKLSENGDVYP